MTKEFALEFLRKMARDNTYEGSNCQAESLQAMASYYRGRVDAINTAISIVELLHVVDEPVGVVPAMSPIPPHPNHPDHPGSQCYGG